MEAHAVEHVHHGPPEAHRSSRVDPRTLGMLLFIISEVMVFGAFFTAYFFIRIVTDNPWPAEGMHLPVAVGGLSSSVDVADGAGDGVSVSWGVTWTGIPVGSSVGGRDDSPR